MINVVEYKDPAKGLCNLVTGKFSGRPAQSIIPLHISFIMEKSPVGLIQSSETAQQRARKENDSMELLKADVRAIENEDQTRQEGIYRERYRE